MEILWIILKALFIIISQIVAFAYYTLAERHLLAALQRRKGPKVVGFEGLLQPLADGLKLLTKETVIPTSANTTLFIIAPIITFTLSILKWCVIPFGESAYFTRLELSLLFTLAISSLGVYGIIIAGWSSNSKYAFLGGLRSAAQMISYEVSLTIMVVCVILCSGSIDLIEINRVQKDIWYITPLLPVASMFFISILAETNRAPFDLPEAEAELVAGYNVEYSAFSFAMFFIGEYINMMFIGALYVILFLGGYNYLFFSFSILFLDDIFSFVWKNLLIVFMFIWIRGAFPRFRYDQLMFLGWKVFLPFSLGWVFLTASILICFNWLPYIYL
jgi:NADH-quinone oxidoreductase subunit H